MSSAHPILLGSLIALTATVGIGIGVRLFMSRTSQNQVAQQEQVDIAKLRPPLPPPSFLACPPHYCLARPGTIVPIFAVPWQQLSDDWLKMIAGQARVTRVDARPHRLQITYIQHSLVFRFPDIITVEFVPFGPDRSSLALYSRSRYGRYDFHKNRRRIETWLGELEKLIAFETPVSRR